MIATLKKSLYATIGIALLTKENIDKTIKKILEEIRGSEAEGKEFFDAVIKKAEEKKLSVEKMIEEKVVEILNKLNIPTKKEMEELDSRLRKIETSHKTTKA
ncbi:MAG: phasin family protein [Chitinispirillaceae bacterium]|nr:phasin family protein [Chitinispirillaceae bacterium]